MPREEHYWKAVYGKVRLLERKKEGGEISKSKRKNFMTEPPPVDSEPEPEIGNKSESDEAQERVGSGTTSDSCQNDDD